MDTAFPTNASTDLPGNAVNIDFSASTSYSLLERSIAGDSGAWTYLSDLYAPMIYKWVRDCGVQPADASDITQKTFLKVLDHLGKFQRGRGRFRGWLWTISRNLVRDLADERARSHATIAPIELERIEKEPWDAVESDAPPRQIVARALRHIEHDFDDRTRLVLEEVIMAGRQPKDVAEELKMSINAVYIARSRAVKKLKRLLADVEYPTKMAENSASGDTET